MLSAIVVPHDFQAFGVCVENPCAISNGPASGRLVVHGLLLDICDLVHQLERDLLGRVFANVNHGCGSCHFKPLWLCC